MISWMGASWSNWQNIEAQTITIARYQEEGFSQTTWYNLPEQAHFVEHTPIDNMLSKVSSRLYIIRNCKDSRYPPEHLSKLFDSLILSTFAYGIQVWGTAFYRKDSERIDRFKFSCKRAARFGYTKRKITISELISQHDDKLFKQISSNEEHILKDLLPEKRTRPLRNSSHSFIVPYVKTERFKQCYINRCLFK